MFNKGCITCERLEGWTSARREDRRPDMRQREYPLEMLSPKLGATFFK